MLRERSSTILLFCIIITIATGVLQYLNPSLRIFDTGLITAILLTVFLKEEKYTLLFGIISVVLILISAVYANYGQITMTVLLPYLFSALIAVLTTIAVLYIKKLYYSIEMEKQQVNALFQFATQGIILTNQRGDIVLANPEAERLFGYSTNELLGKSIEILLPQRVRTQHVAHREDFYKQPSSRRMGHGRDLFAIKKNKEEFPVEVSLSYYEQKNQYFVIAFIVDITQRKTAERKMMEQHAELEKVTTDIRKLNADLETKVEERTTILREALQKLEKSQEELSHALSKEKELNEIKSRFVSMASHEFRTPLSTVLSSASLIQNYVKAEEQDNRIRHVKRIKESVKHLNYLLEDFLSLGKLEEGRVKTEVQRFNVKEFIDDVIEEMKPILKNGQELRLTHSEDQMFSSDKRMVRNILINLISNAVKFSPENKPIYVKISNRQKVLKMIVQDEGMGISKEDQHHLFSTFFRGANVVNIQGTGLGLNIVQRYVELLGGKVSLESELDVGTTVTVQLPFMDPGPGE
ncbi:MAG TPA: PAS domain-containing sensor histidine kinase [Chitinophagaceae bacterium]